MQQVMTLDEILQLVRNGAWTGSHWEVDMYRKGDLVEFAHQGQTMQGHILAFEYNDFRTSEDVYSVDTGKDFPLLVHESRLTKVKGGE